MKIEVKEKANKEYYDELLYIVSNNTLKKNPHSKVKKITTHSILLGLISLIILIPFIILYIYDHYVMYLVVIVLFSISIILSIFYYILINKKLDEMVNTNKTSIFEINKDGVSIKVDKEEHKLKYKEIDNIIINKYSICFMSSTNQSLYTRIEYKEQVIEALTKYKQDKLIIDNSKLYK